ncbi:MAG: hypothetical protein Fur0041_23420 [Bacteroidia bacterium]
MKYLMSVIFSVFAANMLFAQGFEGILEFKEQSGTEVQNSVFYIKGDKVRIDEFKPGTRMIVQSNIIDTKSGTVTLLDHVNKTWITKTVTDKPAALKDGQVSNSKNSKEYFGYKCREYAVKSASGGNTISIWATSGNFYFFPHFIELTGKSDFFPAYYLSLGLKDGSMPMLITETDAQGKELSRTEVTRLDKKTLDDALFAIPRDFRQAQ